jgi:AcrR family transcriptional regulator
MVTSRSHGNAASRDSEAMRERILDALGQMVVRDGLSAVGVNALAREAGCDKVLIYRYFGTLDGVYEDFAARSDFWWTVEDLVRDVDPRKTILAAAMKLILRRHAEAIRARPVTLAVLAAEPVERTPLVVALESVREKRSLALGQWIVRHYRIPDGIDFQAITMLLGVAVNYLAVRGRKIRVMSGVPIKSEKDWERVLAAIDALIEGVLRSA